MAQIAPMRNDQRARMVGALLAGALGGTLVTSEDARAEGWVNARIPVGAHIGPPEHGVESGLHLDFLAVFPITGKKRNDYDALNEFRLGLGPSLELKTLDVDQVGFRVGIEGLVLFPASIPVTHGFGLEAGIGKWLAGPAQSLSSHLTLSAQLRGGGSTGGTSFSHTTAVFARIERSFEDEWALVIGLEFGGDPTSWFFFLTGGDW